MAKRAVFSENPVVGFGIAYGALTVVALASVVAFFAILFTPVTPVAHKSDVNSIRSALGATQDAELVKQAEANIASQASQSGVSITSQKVTKVTHPSKDEVDVHVHVSTVEVGPVDLKVVFHKGIYSITGVSSE